jgi:hypothetical protein
MSANFAPALSPSPALCPHHEKPALGPCTRCGTFRCEDCGETGLCVACLERNAVAPWYAISQTKLLTLYICTAGLYSLYWMYQHWKRVKERGEDVWPAPRALFFGITSFGLFGRMSRELSAAGLTPRFSARTMAWLVLITNVGSRLPGPLWTIGFLQVVPLFLIQRDINELNAKLAPAADKNDRFTAGNIAVTVIGAVIVLLGLAGILLRNKS